MTDLQKAVIDGLDQEQLCRIWRFGGVGESLLQGDTGEYFKKRLDEKGGFTPEISKILGWGK